MQGNSVRKDYAREQSATDDVGNNESISGFSTRFQIVGLLLSSCTFSTHQANEKEVTMTKPAILASAGMVMIATYFLIAALYSDENYFLPEGDTTIITSAYFCLGIGWLTGIAGIVFGVKYMIISRNRSLGQFKEFRNYSILGAILIATGWCTLGSIIAFNTIIVDEKFHANLVGSCYLISGSGFMIMGYGLYTGMRELMMVCIKRGGYKYMKYSYITQFGCILFGTGVMLPGFIIILEIYTSAFLFLALHHLLQGIGIALIITGFILAFRTSYIKSDDHMKEKEGSSMLGTISNVIFCGAIIIFMVVYLFQSLPYFGYHYKNEGLIDLEDVLSDRDMNIFIMIGYFILAAAFPLAFYGGFHMVKKDKIDSMIESSSFGEGLINTNTVSPQTMPRPMNGPIPQQGYQTQPYPPQQFTYNSQISYQQTQTPVSNQQRYPQTGYQSGIQNSTIPTQIYHPPSQINHWTCKRCGSNNQADYNFCNNCGEKR